MYAQKKEEKTPLIVSIASITFICRCRFVWLYRTVASIINWSICDYLFLTGCGVNTNSGEQWWTRRENHIQRTRPHNISSHRTFFSCRRTQYILSPEIVLTVFSNIGVWSNIHNMLLIKHCYYCDLCFVADSDDWKRFGRFSINDINNGALPVRTHRFHTYESIFAQSTTVVR